MYQLGGSKDLVPRDEWSVDSPLGVVAVQLPRWW